MPQIDVIPAVPGDRGVLERLLELYSYDFSEIVGRDVDAAGVYGYRHLDLYWTEPGRAPFLIRVDGHWAGFALVRSGEPHDMAEFFVMRKYRHGGIGRTAAANVIGRFPGRWQIRQVPANQPAIAFWRTVIPAEFDESLIDGFVTQRFTV